MYVLNKEKVDALLAKIGDDKKEAFVAEAKKADKSEDFLAILKKYGVDMTDEELKDLQENRELSDDELDMISAAGCFGSSDVKPEETAPKPKPVVKEPLSSGGGLGKGIYFL